MPRQATAVQPSVTLASSEQADVHLHLSGGQVLQDVEFTFGSFPQARKREILDGFGFGIELPAVLDLLQLIKQRQADPGEVQDLLVQAARELYLPLEAYEHEEDDNLDARCKQAPQTCPLCPARREWFEAELDSADEMWSRYHQPETYPFIAGREGLHQIDCPAVRRAMPDAYARPTGDTYTAELRRYAHSVDPHSGYSDLTYAHDYPRWKAMTTTETRTWMTEHTGPKGGRSYKICRRCSPTP